MRRRLALLLLLPAFALACAPDSPTVAASTGATQTRLDGSDQGGRLFEAALSGANEVTNAGVTGVGDADGRGDARVTVNAGQGQICYEIEVANIVLPAAFAHIHRGVAGKNGPVIVTFVAPNAAGVSSGCATVSREFAQELASDPAGFYVNIHNSVFPSGVVRGQLQ